MSLLELKNIVKSFGTHTVLNKINFTLEKGEVHALLGENGAGKSTILNLIGGLFPPNSGEIMIEGKPIENYSIIKSKEMGIGFVHQEIELCQDVTVAENIMMASICEKKTWNINFTEITENAQMILEPLVGNGINPKEIVSNLSISQQQIVEIAKTLSHKCKILLLDEPTAALSEPESQALFQVMKKLTQKGIGIIFISHRMEEVFKHSDRVTVLRDGNIISTYQSQEVSMEQLMKDMAGRKISDIYPKKPKDIDYLNKKILLEVKNLSDSKNRFHNINITLYEGEILGIAGLVGSGRTEIMQTIVNLRKRKSGNVFFLNTNIDHLSTSNIYEKGLILLSEDRKKSGLFMDYSISQNICSTYLDIVTENKFINKRKENSLAYEKVRELNIKCNDINQTVNTLSGGNQQKVLLAKLLAKKPIAVMLDEPTRGVDAGAKSEIANYIRELANTGVGVIIISSEMNELLGMSDRLLCIDIEGYQVTEHIDNMFNPDKIIYYISGAYKYKEVDCVKK